VVEANAAKKCNHCGLWNPSTAEICDCGYQFATGTILTSSPSAGQTGPSVGLLFSAGVVFGAIGAAMMFLFMLHAGMGFSAVPNWTLWSAGCGSLLVAAALFVLAATSGPSSRTRTGFVAISYVLAAVTSGFALWGIAMQYIGTRPRY
jgi:hypothetical protein